ncbi:Y-family DNA polymerase [Oribacterium sp. WCC10]|uniref:Y-family DNA polymerase n=1 Tax=Oribacterium sp. WCC10 TaxID=1855343 RepID=UPI0008EF50CD|nr:DNA polymerase IV [Oribacterium sp. WCC10]SFG72033.1 impB/mucB/samB family C-terminal domain-containing protein [Oribacterium sp. WCC10]
MLKTILHIDVNSAFLSWTAVKLLKENPNTVDLRTIPSAIGGDIETRHGIITAKSIPAGKFGIKTAMPVVKALELCPDLVLAKSDFDTYRKYSHDFIDILKKYSPVVEQVSIDEAFIDLTDMEQTIKSHIYEQIVDGSLSIRDKTSGFLSESECFHIKQLLTENLSSNSKGIDYDYTSNQDNTSYKDSTIFGDGTNVSLFQLLNNSSVSRVQLYKALPFPINAAVLIKNEIYETLGFTVNVGISNNKLLAKMASDLEKPNRIHTLYPSEIPFKMWPLPISDLFGCGGKTALKLEKIGIHNIGDAAKMNPEVLIGLLGKNSGLYIHSAANGLSYGSVSDQVEEAKSISNELTTTVDIDTSNYYTDGLDLIRKLSEQVSRRLTKHGLYANTVGFSVKTDDFKRRSIQKKLSDSTNSIDIIYNSAVELSKELLLGINSINNSDTHSSYPETIYLSTLDSSDPHFPKSDNSDTINHDSAIPSTQSGLFGLGFKVRLMCISTSNFDHGEYHQMTLDDLINSSEELKKEKKLLKKRIMKQKKHDDLSSLLKAKFGDSVVKKGFD